jgi:hypothetical protein
MPQNPAAVLSIDDFQVVGNRIAKAEQDNVVGPAAPPASTI